MNVGSLERGGSRSSLAGKLDWDHNGPWSVDGAHGRGVWMAENGDTRPAAASEHDEKRESLAVRSFSSLDGKKTEWPELFSIERALPELALGRK